MYVSANYPQAVCQLLGNLRTKILLVYVLTIQEEARECGDIYILLKWSKKSEAIAASGPIRRLESHPYVGILRTGSYTYRKKNVFLNWIHIRITTIIVRK